MPENYTFVAIPRFTFVQLQELAKKDEVAAVCGNDFFKKLATKRDCFTYASKDSPEGFLLNGKTQFADEYRMEWWLLDGYDSLLGRLGSHPKGRTLGQFMKELPVKWRGLTPKRRAKLRMVSVLVTVSEYHFAAYTGNPRDLVSAISDLSGR